MVDHNNFLQGLRRDVVEPIPRKYTGVEMKRSKTKRLLMKNLCHLHVCHQENHKVRMRMILTLTVTSMTVIMMLKMVMMICLQTTLTKMLMTTMSAQTLLSLKMMLGLTMII